MASMSRIAVLLALVVSIHAPAYAQATAQTPAAPAPPKTIIQLVRDQIAKDDFAGGERTLRAFIAEKGATPEALEALSWLGRGQLAANRLDEAMRFAFETERMVDEALKTRGLDDETHLPLALGASYEVQAQATAKQGDLGTALRVLTKSIDTYKNTSIVARLQKNLNLLTLEGKPAPEYSIVEFLGTKPPTLASLRGKTVMLFFWAHWCPDCKAMAPTLRDLQAEYKDQGFVIVAPTQRYGYVAKRAPAKADVEMKYMAEVLAEFYKGVDWTIPVSEQSFTNYGSSTTPTVVMIDRAGIVTIYHPGQMTRAELEPQIRKALGASTAP
jgi:thiol-disulfide isomerase/thioredoxin